MNIWNKSFKNTLDGFKVFLDPSHTDYWRPNLPVDGLAFQATSTAYYLDFSAKTFYSGPFDSAGVFMTDFGGQIGVQYFVIDMAQYALGCWKQAWDIEPEKSQDWFQKFYIQVSWLLEHQVKKDSTGVLAGVWLHYFPFSFQGCTIPWWAGMAQGQAISVLIRAYWHSGEQHFLEAARLAACALILPLEEGGCGTIEEPNGHGWFLQEYNSPDYILNGCIFALWGLYDLYRATNEESWKEWIDRVNDTLEYYLSRFDMGYYSAYEMYGKPNGPCTPFYHRLHIKQLNILAKLTGRVTFSEYAKRWELQNTIYLNRLRALIAKMAAKIKS